MTKVGIVYGWAEGKAHAKKLMKSLHEHKFSVTRDLENADVLISHSGGMYLIPEHNHAKLILLVGYPNWPNKSPYISLQEKIRQELTHKNSVGFMIRKTFFNIFYLITSPLHHIKIRRSWQKKLLPVSTNIVAVRNQHDTFMHDKTAKKHAGENDWNIISLPGNHDDLWQNPERYVKIISKLI